VKIWFWKDVSEKNIESDNEALQKLIKFFHLFDEGLFGAIKIIIFRYIIDHLHSSPNPNKQLHFPALSQPPFLIALIPDGLASIFPALKVQWLISVYPYFP